MPVQVGYCANTNTALISRVLSDIRMLTAILFPLLL